MSLRYIVITLSAFVLSIVITGCGQQKISDFDDLSRISQLIDEGKPDSALTMLSELDFPDNSDIRNTYITLLRCGAYERLNIPITDINAILDAASVLKDSDKLPLTKYYLSKAYLYNLMFPEAISEASEAATHHRADSSVMSRSYLVIALCHREAMNATSELAYAEMALDADPHSADAMIMYACALIDNEQYDKCIDFISRKADAPVDLKRLMITPAIETKNYDLAAGIINRLTADSIALTTDETINLAILHVAYGRRNEAAQIIDSLYAEASQSRLIISRLAEAEKLLNNEQAVNRLNNRLIAIQDSIIGTLAESRIYESLYDIEHSRSLENETKAQRSATRFIIAIIAGVTLTLFLIMLVVYRKSVEKRRLSESENRILALNEELKRQRDEHHKQNDSLSSMKRNVDRLFKEHYESVEMAANLLLDTSMSKDPDKKISDLLSRQVAACREPKFLSTLENTVNEYRNNAIARMRNDISTLSDAEIIIVLYSAAGLSSRVICHLTNQTAAALYNKKYRIKKKFAASESQYRDEFIDLIK